MSDATKEQTFFDDAASDRILGVVMALASEVYVLRDRQRALERLLDEQGSISRADLDREPTPEDVQADDEDRKRFVAGLMENLLGRQVSKGAGGSGL
jgi:hypothetical protein